jgi:ABC-type nitrate/sulfonate/bicarbonate transport system permease component
MVFFLVFFNTFKGSQSIERELVDFCRTLGASPARSPAACACPMRWPGPSPPCPTR